MPFDVATAQGLRCTLQDHPELVDGVARIVCSDIKTFDAYDACYVNQHTARLDLGFSTYSDVELARLRGWHRETQLK